MLSAAHCFDEVTSYIGQAVYVNATGPAQGIERYIKKVIIHPLYNQDTIQWDFAVVQLTEPVEMADSPVLVLNTDNEYPSMSSTMTTLIGHGRTSTNGPLSDETLFLLEPFVLDSVCEDIWPINSMSMLCTGGSVGEGGCNGDSGGPVVVENDNEHLLIGAVSWGSSFCASGLPVVHARVSAAIPWLNEVACPWENYEMHFCTTPSPSISSAPSTADRWMQMGADIDGEFAFDRSGDAVALSRDGTTLAIGAPLNNNSTGHVRVWKWNETGWVQKGEDIDGSFVSDIWSGDAVSLSTNGDILAIASPYYVEDGVYVGQVRVVAWDGQTWLQMGEAIKGYSLFNELGGAGISLSSNGTVLAIGSSSDNSDGLSENGRVGVFQWTGTSWVQKGDDIAGEGWFDYSGSSVALSRDGNAVIIGSRFNDGNGDNSGHARVWKWTGNTWQTKGQDLDGVDAGDLAGFSVSISGDGNVVAIGAVLNSDGGLYAGQVRLFEWSGTSWLQLGQSLTGNLVDAWFGFSIDLSMDGMVIAVGAPSILPPVRNPDLPGYVEVFDFDFTSFLWTQRGKRIVGESPQDLYGSFPLLYLMMVWCWLLGHLEMMRMALPVAM